MPWTAAQLNIGRDQILDRLWELATLSHEATRGSIAGQIKALSMIVAIEGLIPDRRLSPSGTQPAAPPVKPQIYQRCVAPQTAAPTAGEEPGDPVAAQKPNPTPPTSPTRSLLPIRPPNRRTTVAP